MSESRSYRLVTRLMPAGPSRGGGWRPARWVAELRLEGWTSAELVALGEGESEREAVDSAMTAVRG